MSHLMTGLTEMQMIKIVESLKKGDSYDKATEFLDNEVEPAAIARNEEYLTNKANDQLEAAKPPTLKVESDEPKKPTHKR